MCAYIRGDLLSYVRCEGNNVTSRAVRRGSLAYMCESQVWQSRTNLILRLVSFLGVARVPVEDLVME